MHQTIPLPGTLECTDGWRFPAYSRMLLASRAAATPRLLAPWSLLPAASFIEWRYIAILSRQFHGIVGMSLVNPFGLAGRLAESGLLFILAGVVDVPYADMQQRGATSPASSLHEVCWMHMFPTRSLRFAGDDVAVLEAADGGFSLQVVQHTPQHGSVRCSGNGLHIQVEQRGLAGTHIAPCFADDLRRTPAAHWVVYNPSPLATVSGSIGFAQGSLGQLPQRQHTPFPNFVSAPLAQRTATHDYTIELAQENGYYEHSFGINPLPLHGWDFLFVPDAARGQGVVLQTYPRSRMLRYVEAFWREGDTQKYTRFDAESVTLRWKRTRVHPDMRVRLPLTRTISARSGGLHLEVENTILHHIPFLRPASVAVRHFFIAEEVGMTNWRLRESSGRLLAEAKAQPSGGEVAHARLFVNGRRG